MRRDWPRFRVRELSRTEAAARVVLPLAWRLRDRFAPGGLAFYGGGALVAGLILLLATAVDGWIAALIVAAALFAGAGILALTGKKQIDQATPPQPEEAKASVQRDVDEVKARASK